MRPLGATLWSGPSGLLDISTLNLTLWARAAYAGSPWSGTASAGSSGSLALANATAPAVGAAVNGFNRAEFNGSTQILTNATDVNSITSTTAWSTVALVYPDAVGNTYPNIICDAGGWWGVGLRSNSGNKAYVYQFSGSAKYADAAISLSDWSLIQAYYDGVNIGVRVNSGAWVTTACGSVSTSATTIVAGRNYASSSFFNGGMLELMVSASAFSLATFDNIKAALNSRYALSL